MTKSNQSRSPTKARVSKSDWLNTALGVLEEGGISSVRVEVLASRLGVAKSGFYYHFRDREDLYEKLLDHWLTLDGSPFIKERLQRGATPKERLKIVGEVVDKARLSRYDFAIRQWARLDKKVRRAWKNEMKKRLEHIRSIFRDLGFEGDELEARARIFVAYQVGDLELFGDLSSKERDKFRALRIDLLTRKFQDDSSPDV